MDDEPTLREAEMRVRDALLPDDLVTRRVVASALADRDTHRRSARGLRPAWTIAASALILAIAAATVGVWQSRRSTSASSAPLAVTGRGSVVVVERQDGRRWVIGPPPERDAGGNYVIALQK